MKTRTITFRMLEKKVRSVDLIAKLEQRDRSFILNRAIDHYLTTEHHNREMIEDGLRQAKAGLGVSQEDVLERYEKGWARAGIKTRAGTKKMAS